MILLFKVNFKFTDILRCESLQTLKSEEISYVCNKYDDILIL